MIDTSERNRKFWNPLRLTSSANRQSLPVYKYSPEMIDVLSAKREHIIELSNREIKIGPAVFLSPDSYSLALDVHNYLALTYFPRYRYQVMLDFHNHSPIDNTGSPITSARALAAAPRVWPAFGQDGGGNEILIEPNRVDLSTLNFIGDPAVLADGGAFDSYRQDNAQKYDFDLAEQIAKGLYAVILLSEPTDRERRIVGKANEDGFVVFTVEKYDLNYSLSVGYKILGNQIKLKFWVSLWRDIGNIRRVLGPLTETITYTLWGHGSHPSPETFKNRIRIRLEDQKPPFFMISDLVKQIMTRATNISRTFFLIRSRTMALPLF